MTAESLFLLMRRDIAAAHRSVALARKVFPLQLVKGPT